MTSAPQDGPIGGQIERGSWAALEIGAASNVLPFPCAQDLGEVRDVERINQYSFYNLGTQFRALTTATKGDVPRVEAFMPVYNAKQSLGRMLHKGDPVHLGVSKGPASDFMSTLDAVFDEFFQEDGNDGKRVIRFPDAQDLPIPEWRWSFVTTALERFETVFREEMREAATYFVPRKGIFFTPALVDTADDSFPVEVRPHIPSKTLEDWKAAGRCLAFSLLTASGFHVARAVEGTIEAYYQIFSNQPGKTLHNWFEYATELSKLAKSGQAPAPSDKTVAEILQMKDDYRNPLMHPRVVLNEADAKMLFCNGESLIIGMAQEIAAAKANAGVQAPLALVPPAGGSATP